ncbi:MAG: dTDP-4-dehydrorhamnose reductase [Alistipes sp.]|jgi:dTDP-4-dehydrorhamnose reductase|nr:dTDP-4-dehydrorhamnose reductase [Alistipes sp.]
MRVLVTGAGGQLGTALRESAGAPVTGDEWLFTDLAEVAGLTESLNITDRGAVDEFIGRRRPDVVVNCAAFTDVDRAETERGAAYLVNRDAPRFLAGAAVRVGAAMIHVSTDFVFDGNGSRPYTEDDRPAPLNVYGESKLAGERAVMESGVRGAVVRTSWLYSPWGKNFVKAILRAAGANDTIRVVADQSGCPTSALSLAGAIVDMIPELGEMGLFHFCDAGTVSRADFAVEIIRQAGLSCRVVPVGSDEYPSPARRPIYSALDTAKITRTFGIAPRPWQEPLAGCIKTLKDGR